MGQVSVLVTLGIVSALALHQQGRSALGGIALALVTCIKYYPGAFVIYFFVRRDGRFLAAYGAGLLGFYGLLPAALLGPVDWWYFERASAQSLPEAARLLRDLIPSILSMYSTAGGSRWDIAFWNRRSMRCGLQGCWSFAPTAS